MRILRSCIDELKAWQKAFIAVTWPLSIAFAVAHACL